MAYTATTRLIQPANPNRARQLLWFTLLFFVVTLTIGLGWDRRWHSVHTFDTFYSPPHLFTYSMMLLSSLLVASIAFRPSLRTAFEQGPSTTIRLPLLGIAMPGCLVLLGSGFVILALAGLLDDIWHTNFGLDETGWSTPHAMIGWGLLVIALGFVACRLALQPSGTNTQLSTWTALVVSGLVVIFSATPILGPFHANKLPAMLQLIRFLPVFKAQPPVQHTYRIYLQWNITRTNSWLAPLGGLWAGALLAVLRGLDLRARIWLTIVLLWSVWTLLGDRAAVRGFDRYFDQHLALNPISWLPLPLLPAALTLLLVTAIGLPEKLAWPLAGIVFAVCINLFWGPHARPLLLVLVTALTAWIGGQLGGYVARTLRRPTRNAVLGLAMAGVAVPLLTGALDVYLRKVTP